MSAVCGEIIGSTDLRRDLSDFLSQTINKKRVFLVGRLHRQADTAILMPTEMLVGLLSDVKFDSSVIYDEDTKQYVASIRELNADGVGATREDAVEMALDNVEALLDDFLSSTDKYLSFAKLREHVPYYLKLIVGGRSRLAETVGFRTED
jgi:predicted RNase H-like HicB family nuclease